MRITISYTAEEREEATADLAALLQRHPSARVKRSNANPPYFQIYLNTKKRTAQRERNVETG